MSVSLADKMFLFICLIELVGAVACVGVSLRLAYTRLDEMLGYFKNSPSVMTRTVLSDAGPWGKLLVLGAIAGVVIYPKLHLRSGGVDEDDLKHFPNDIRRKLRLINRVSLVLVVFLFGLLVATNLRVFCTFGAQVVCKAAV